jgi:transcriptional regulator with XRE-family HTH domain
MTLAQRVRDCRYSKGWGPDELASRAEISRTALYQIESGKTGLPRAGTLRRIAVALEVPMEDLLGHDGESPTPSAVSERAPMPKPSRNNFGWVPAEGGPLSLTHGPNYAGLGGSGVSEEPRFTADGPLASKMLNHDAVFRREGELLSKLHALLHSPLGDCVTRIVDELHDLLPQFGSSN